jgi:N-methylhydantoinase A
MCVLGMLGPGILANGTVLDREAAAAAFEPVARALRMTVEEAARGTVEIVTASMANAITEITVDQGQDPREAVLLAFGGAGPQFATLLAGHLGMGSAVIPPYAGNFSAYGLLVADLKQSSARTRVTRVDDDALTSGNAILAELFRILDERSANGHGGRETRHEAALDMRYVGQEHSITVDVPWSADRGLGVSGDELLARFARQYEQTYGSEMDENVEIITWRATTRTSLPRRARQAPPAAAAAAPTEVEHGQAYSFTAGAMRDFAIVARAAVTAERPLAGPAIVLEDTATTYVDEGFHAEPHGSGALVISSDRVSR